MIMKSVAIISSEGFSKCAIELSYVEKPPVEIVVKACAKASKVPMPKNIYKNMQAMVSAV